MIRLKTLRGEPGFWILRRLLMGCLLWSVAACASSHPLSRTRPVHVEPIKVWTRSDPRFYASARLGIFVFQTPKYAPTIADETTRIYCAELQATGPFRKTMCLPEVPLSTREALRWGYESGCTLVMVSKIDYVMYGSGASPTQLETEARILEVVSGATLWHFRQRAYSEPGPDIDLFWHTFPGKNAQPYQVLGEALAEQLSLFFKIDLERVWKGKS